MIELLYYLDEILIFKKYQNRGFCSKLLNELEILVKEQGAQKIDLSTTYEENHQKFYSRLGFKKSDFLVLCIKGFEKLTHFIRIRRSKVIKIKGEVYMKFNYGKAILTFVVGFIISFIVGSIFEDSGIAIMTAVCYVGAIVSGVYMK